MNYKPKPLMMYELQIINDLWTQTFNDLQTQTLNEL